MSLNNPWKVPYKKVLACEGGPNAEFREPPHKATLSCEGENYTNQLKAKGLLPIKKPDKQLKLTEEEDGEE